MQKKVVYTAIFGQKDELKSFAPSKGVDYILFTDDPNIKSELFTIKYVPAMFYDPTRSAKFYKIMSHLALPDYHYSLWIDASISIHNIDVNRLFDDYLNAHDLAAHLHPDRTCVYDEAEACISLNRDNHSVIASQMAEYKFNNYPKNNGLIAANIIYRRKTTSVQRLNEAWWKEICKYSRRDQLSFPYVCHLLGFEFYPIPGYVTVKHSNVDGFRMSPHKRNEDFPS